MAGLMSRCRMSRWCSPPRSWDTPQAVTRERRSGMMTTPSTSRSCWCMSGADGGYDEVAAELAVAVVDDDTPAVVIEPQETG